tara:strand:- start:160 stop:819 length:660 start_codon:yes stop_codon:yes gene_type:complete
MALWIKVIGGAAIGVGAVAAAPFTGGGSILGAATLVSSLTGAGAIAAGVGAVGATAGAVANRREKKLEKDKIFQAKKEGKQESEIEKAIEIEKLKAELACILADIEIRENFLVTAFAVGICAANADNEICESEKEEIEELVAGLGRNKTLSKVTQDRLKEWYKNPPNLTTVWAIIKNNKLDSPDYLETFDKIVNMVVWADGEKNIHEDEFINAWNRLVA